MHRFSETLANQLEPHGILVFPISPGLVRTRMTDSFGNEAPWTPPELAPRLVRAPSRPGGWTGSPDATSTPSTTTSKSSSGARTRSWRTT